MVLKILILYYTISHFRGFCKRWQEKSVENRLAGTRREQAPALRGEGNSGAGLVVDVGAAISRPECDTFLSPNKKVSKEVGLRGGARVGVAVVTWKLFGKVAPPNTPPS